MKERWNRRFVVLLAGVSLFLLTAGEACLPPPETVMWNESDQTVYIYRNRDTEPDAMGAVVEYLLGTMEPGTSLEDNAFDHWAVCADGPLTARTSDGALVEHWPGEKLRGGQEWVIDQADVDSPGSGSPILPGPAWAVANDSSEIVDIRIISDSEEYCRMQLYSGWRWSGTRCLDTMAFVAEGKGVVTDAPTTTDGPEGTEAPVESAVEEQSAEREFIVGPTRCPIGTTWSITDSDLAAAQRAGEAIDTSQ